jgi:hypothetical protein
MAAERRSRSVAGAGRRFAWYGRLSTKDKQDPTLSFPSQREACAAKAEELGGEIVYEFTDQERFAPAHCRASMPAFGSCC